MTTSPGSSPTFSTASPRQQICDWRSCGSPFRAAGGKTQGVDIALAGPADLTDLARLLWLHATPAEQGRQTEHSFAIALGDWWVDHSGSHFAFIARSADFGAVGMAWLALVPRVPRPGAAARCSGDVQSVFVLPEQRGLRIGAALITAATRHALDRGAGRVVVQSGRNAVPLYERLGFASSPQLLQIVGE